MLHFGFFSVVRQGLQDGCRSLRCDARASSTLIATFGVFILFQLLVLSTISMEGGIRLIESKTDVQLILQEQATDGEIQDLYENLRHLPFVESVTYTTREQAYAAMKDRDPTLIGFVEKFGIQNPFPETMSVRLHALSSLDRLKAFLRQPLFAHIVNPTSISSTSEQQRQLGELVSITTAMHSLVMIGFTTVVLTLFFLLWYLLSMRNSAAMNAVQTLEFLGVSRLRRMAPLFFETLIILASGVMSSMVVITLALLLLPLLVPALADGGILAPWFSESMSTAGHLRWYIIIVEVLLPFALGCSFSLFSNHATQHHR